ncbi:hypothetical protein O0L34_g15760 [Tuta absoluta]|nr:hypothetical protein O0L34_g15760 [Tuta absoluta]
MVKYELITAYQNLTGLQMSQVDGRPQQICSYCAALLLKCAAFRQKCINAQELLTYAIVEEHQITSEYIHSIDRQSHNLTLPYTTIHNSVTIKQEELTLDNDLTSLLNNIIEQNDVKVEESSDEEPLVKFVKKKKRKRKHDIKGSYTY